MGGKRYNQDVEEIDRRAELKIGKIDYTKEKK